MSYSTILYDVDESNLTITLNRPDILNAFNTSMLSEIIDALDRADADDRIRCTIFTGAGRAFCAGADLSAGGKTFNADARDDKADGPHRDGGGRLTLRIFECKKPVIAAINGPAVGIGATMTLPMDIRLCSSSAKVGFVFSRRGVVPEACSSFFLPRVVGISKALEWCYSGRVFPAEEALSGDLVRSIHKPEDLLADAKHIARELVENTSAVSTALIRQLMWKMLGADHPMEAHKIDSQGMYFTGKSADAKEGIESFLEKRPAKFPLEVSKDMPPFFPWWEDRKFL